MGGRRDCWLCHTARNVIGRTCSQRCKKVQKEKLIQKQIQHTNLNKSKELIKRGWFGLLWLDEEKVF